jgi:hypothetical protein
MRTYRVIVFDMGQANAVVEFDTTEDAAALEEAKTHFKTEQRELWQNGRFVAVLLPESS